MKMNNTNKDMLDAIEKIRKDRYPHLKKDLVKKIIEVETNYSDDRVLASKKISELISDYISEAD